MSTFGPPNAQGFFIEVNKNFSSDWDVFIERFLDAYRDIARATNAKDVGIYDKFEQVNGQQFFQLTSLPGATSSNILRQVYRQTYNIADSNPGGLVVSPGTTLIPHGIVFPVPNTYHFTRIYGVVESLAAPSYAPFPNGDITVRVDGTNIRISGYPAFYNSFTGIAVIEYTKN